MLYDTCTGAFYSLEGYSISLEMDKYTRIKVSPTLQQTVSLPSPLFTDAHYVFFPPRFADFQRWLTFLLYVGSRFEGR